MIDRYESVTWEAKKVALKAELNNLRQAILLFKITKGRYPESLKELISEYVVSPHKDILISAKYLEPYSVDNDLNVLDSFDLPFTYDHLTGRVRSQKNGFEDW